MRVYKIQANPGETSYIEKSWPVLEDVIQTMSIGTQIIITPVEMTEDEINVLPEFMGF